MILTRKNNSVRGRKRYARRQEANVKSTMIEMTKIENAR